nr:hypothetical protein [uncultured bacterium]
MDSDDIRQMLSGDYDGAPDDELPAVLFAQHYADTGGNPDPEAWVAVEKEYGPDLARGILGAARAMMGFGVLSLPVAAVQAGLSKVARRPILRGADS